MGQLHGRFNIVLFKNINRKPRREMSDFIESNTLDLNDLGDISDEKCLELLEQAEVDHVTETLDDVQLRPNTVDDVVHNDAIIELEPTPEIAPVEIPAKRTVRRRRVAEKDWGKSPEPIEQSRRPGPKPALTDANLTKAELERKNRRRDQNKKAAKKQRQMRIDKVRGLEEQHERDQQELKQAHEKNKQLCEQRKRDQQAMKQILAAASRGNTRVYLANDMNTSKPIEQAHCETQANGLSELLTTCSRRTAPAYCLC